MSQNPLDSVLVVNFQLTFNHAATFMVRKQIPFLFTSYKIPFVPVSPEYQMIRLFFKPFKNLVHAFVHMEDLPAYSNLITVSGNLHGVILRRRT